MHRTKKFQDPKRSEATRKELHRNIALARSYCKDYFPFRRSYGEPLPHYDSRINLSWRGVPLASRSAVESHEVARSFYELENRVEAKRCHRPDLPNPRLRAFAQVAARLVSRRIRSGCALRRGLKRDESRSRDIREESRASSSCLRFDRRRIADVDLPPQDSTTERDRKREGKKAKKERERKERPQIASRLERGYILPIKVTGISRNPVFSRVAE